MKPRELIPGEIMQIDPAHQDGREGQHFGGTLMVVTESKLWGAIGYVQNAGNFYPLAYKCQFQHMEPTGGRAVWMIPRDGGP